MLISRSWFALVMAALLQPWTAFADVPAANTAPVILVVGDSLSAGYGVAVDATWVALLQRQLTQQGYGYRMVNASVSGETTGGARPRLARALELHKPAIVIIELGGNDGLRALPLRQVSDNLAAMLAQSQNTGARPLLVGMRIPPNYGPAYAEQFHAMYSELAKKFKVPMVDFFLEGVALNEKLMQPDGIHPTAQAQPLLLKNLWPVLQPLLKK
jgi:acyl-CoA thioesterase I